jgi:hypothetical protein
LEGRNSHVDEACSAPKPFEDYFTPQKYRYTVKVAPKLPCVVKQGYRADVYR